MAETSATIGLLVGRENTFPGPFIDHINARNIPGVRAEFVKLGGTAMNEETPYRVIVDRISHEVPYYRCYLKAAAFRGVTVINDPFWWGSDDKFLENLIAERVGVAVPKTLLLPNKDYIEGITPESLRNLHAPLDWDAMLDYVGRPAILKPAIGGGWKNVYKVADAEDLIRSYDETGQLQMILQEFITWDQYVRCICIGRTEIRPIPYDPSAPFEHRYVQDDTYLSPQLHERIVGDARKLVQALGYDMDTVEFAIRDGVPVAIDFLNPAPDFDSFSIKPHNFEWALETMADLVIGYAQGQAQPERGYIWQDLPFRATPPLSPFQAREEGQSGQGAIQTSSPTSALAASAAMTQAGSSPAQAAEVAAAVEIAETEGGGETAPELASTTTTPKAAGKSRSRSSKTAAQPAQDAPTGAAAGADTKGRRSRKKAD